MQSGPFLPAGLLVTFGVTVVVGVTVGLFVGVIADVLVTAVGLNDPLVFRVVEAGVSPGEEDDAAKEDDASAFGAVTAAAGVMTDDAAVDCPGADEVTIAGDPCPVSPRNTSTATIDPVAMATSATSGHRQRLRVMPRELVRAPARVDGTPAGFCMMPSPVDALTGSTGVAGSVFASPEDDFSTSITAAPSSTKPVRVGAVGLGGSDRGLVFACASCSVG